MTELVCLAFIVAFLLFYSGLFLVLAGAAIRSAFRRQKNPAGRLKRVRDLAFSPQTQPN
jgi:hypothetical protein